jgi:hypothetical protein
MTNALTVFSDIEHFEVSQRMAKALTASTLVPAHFQGEQNLGNALIALEMAQRMNMSPLAVFQSLYVVHGRPAFSASFLIACFNASGKYTPIQYQQIGEEGTPGYGFRALSSIRETGEAIEGPAVTMAIAKAEGWTRNAKYQTMPELMLRYRAATWMIRQVAPEMTMGLHTLEEQELIPAAERNVTGAASQIMARARENGEVDKPAEYIVTPTEKPEPEPRQYTETEEAQAEKGPAPSLVDGMWVDIRGYRYDERFHGHAAGAAVPSVSSSGVFRRRRGHDAGALAEYERAEQARIDSVPAPVATLSEVEEVQVEGIELAAIPSADEETEAF